MRKQREAKRAPAATAGSADVLAVRAMFAAFRSAPMVRALDELGRLASDRDVPVLIEGESGTGKTLLARYVHALSPRSEGPFQHVLVAALDDALASSELFGHVVGAFTDARRDRPGYFALANRGTLFLDEIGKASLSVQRKLLHAIEHGEIHPIGSDVTLRIDTRVVAASNVPIADLVTGGEFLPDLYARIESFRVRLPPLRERRADIELLVNSCVVEHAHALGLTNVPSVDDTLMHALRDEVNCRATARALRSMRRATRLSTQTRDARTSRTDCTAMR